MSRNKKLLWLAPLLAPALVGLWLYGRSRGPHPCDEPKDLPVAGRDVVACAERYVLDQWFTTAWGKFGPLDAEPNGTGSWFDLVGRHRGTLWPELESLCTHAKDPKGALGHTALFAPAGGGQECRPVSVTPLLGPSMKAESCDSVRAKSTCQERAAAVAR